MNMKMIYAAALCVMLLLISACAQKVNDPADLQAIKNLCSEYDKAEIANDSAWFTSTYFLDSAVRMPPNQARIAGKEAIDRQIQDTYEKNTSINQVSSADEIYSSGDLAIATGKYAWRAAPKASGLSVIDEAGNWASAYQRQPDGSWKCIFEIWNSDRPAPGATSNGVEEEALYQLERDWAAASLRKDSAVVEKFLADEFVSNDNGRIQNKRQALSAMKANPAVIESAANTDMKAMVFGDTAIVHGLYVEKSATKGKDSSQQIRYTEVYVKRGGRWQCVTQYLSEVK